MEKQKQQHQQQFRQQVKKKIRKKTQLQKEENVVCVEIYYQNRRMWQDNGKPRGALVDVSNVQ